MITRITRGGLDVMLVRVAEMRASGTAMSATRKALRNPLLLEGKRPPLASLGLGLGTFKER